MQDVVLVLTALHVLEVVTIKGLVVYVNCI